ncbi:hypothetical protein [Bradyrhizobium erythrophlei]|uniref:hypothetical protein n=1 Tax=Bradyrhizobium erythrophlei TaxID=1437360 RepID=UPI001FDA5A88|nr:hypothetical protein [Bradyrhizobium erythrophlei]
MQLLWRIGIIVDIDDDLLAFLEAQQGARKLPVVSGGGNDAILCQFNEPVADPDRMIRCALRRNVRAVGRLSLDPFGKRCRERCDSPSLQQPAPINCHENAPS